MAYSQLLPGLPNDLAFHCLVRIPAKDLARLRQLNYLWKLTIDSVRFYSARRSVSFFPSIFTMRCTNDRYECLDADIADLSSPRLLFSCPLETGLDLFPHGFTLASVGNFVLVMAPGHHVLKLSLITRHWITVNKTIPSWCELHVNTVGGQVVVVGCDDRRNNLDNMMYGSGNADSTFYPTFCEVYDHSKESWSSTEGLPEEFYCTLCLSCDGSAFARGFLSSGSDSVFVLDLAKRRWQENEVMQEKFQNVTHDSKVVAVPRGFLAASYIENHILVQHQGPSHDRWISVMTECAEKSCQFFLCGINKQVLLVISTAGHEWRSRPFPYYSGLHVVRVPCQQNVIAACVCAEA